MRVDYATRRAAQAIDRMIEERARLPLKGSIAWNEITRDINAIACLVNFASSSVCGGRQPYHCGTGASPVRPRYRLTEGALP